MSTKLLHVTPTLTDAFVRIEDQGGGTYNSVSANGSQVFQTYIQYENPPRNPNAAELFTNVNGRLVSLRTIPSNPNFPQVEAGSASPDYSTFALGVSNANDAGQVQVYNSDLSLRGIIPLTNYIGRSITIEIGTFSPDGTLFPVNYAISAPSTGSIISNFDVYNAQTLTLVARTTIPGVSNGGQFFTLKGKTYIALGVGGLLSDFSTLVPPFNVLIYQLSGSTLNLVQSIPQPQFPRSVSVSVINKKTALIAVLTRLATSAGQPSLFINTTGFTSNLGSDTRELRIYGFNGSSAKLLVAKNTYTDSNGLTWIPGTDVLIVSLRTDGSSLPGFAAIYQVTLSNKCDSLANLVNIDFTIVTPSASFFPSVSADGRWLFISGGDSNASGVTEPNLNNITLYHLNYKCIPYLPVDQ
jgi:hypothetical protein